MISLTPIVFRSKSKCYKTQKVQKYALKSQLQALQILKIEYEVENIRLFSFLLAVLEIKTFGLVKEFKMGC